MASEHVHYDVPRRNTTITENAPGGDSIEENHIQAHLRAQTGGGGSVDWRKPLNMISNHHSVMSNTTHPYKPPLNIQHFMGVPPPKKS